MPFQARGSLRPVRDLAGLAGSHSDRSEAVGALALGAAKQAANVVHRVLIATAGPLFREAQTLRC